jgi:hypothetical protein
MGKQSMGFIIVPAVIFLLAIVPVFNTIGGAA